MTKKKMPINSCLFDCDKFKDGDTGPDICTAINRIVYADEDFIEGTWIPLWCPDPKAIKVIEKCDECNRKCGLQGYCWELHRIVDMNTIDKDCPFEDAK